MVESATRALADQFHDELAGLVTGTIQRWDAEETSSQLELLLGRDLQFIRINGTVVGRRRGPGPARHRPGPGLTTHAAHEGADRDHNWSYSSCAKAALSARSSSSLSNGPG